MAYLDIMADWTDALIGKKTPEAFQRARLLADTARRILGALPKTVFATENADDEPVPVADLELACAPPLNPRLLCTYERIEDRLALIHACLNLHRLRNGVPNVAMSYFGDDRIRECWRIEGDICLDEGFWCRPASAYRFLILVQKAQKLAAEVRGLGRSFSRTTRRGTPNTSRISASSTSAS